MVDVQGILERYGVEYTDHGPNVKKGWYYVCCPFCGDDPSHHLGINPETGFWGCWRDKGHRGGNLRYLFRKLLRLNEAELDLLLGKKAITDADKMLADFKALQNGTLTAKAVAAHYDWPDEFVPIVETKGPRRAAWEYLLERGYERDELPTLIKRFDLRCTSHGRFSYRVVFPIVMQGKRLAWTGRDVTGESQQRYKTEDNGHGKDLLYYRALDHKDVILVEGPFDLLRLDWVALSYEVPVSVVAMLGTAVVSGQVGLLAKVLPRGCRLRVAFDAGAMAVAHRLLGDLAPFQPEPMYLPPGLEDPGAATEKQALRILTKALAI